MSWDADKNDEEWHRKYTEWECVDVRAIGKESGVERERDQRGASGSERQMRESEGERKISEK